MVLVLIDNYDFLCKIINYLEKAKILYTTNIEDNYDYIILAELNNKNFSKIKNIKKRIIFFTHLEEKNIILHYKLTNKKSLNYMGNLELILKNTNVVVVSMPFFKEIFNNKIKSKTIIIPNEIGSLNTKINRGSKKSILVVDVNYENVNNVAELAFKYPKYDFNIFGFIPYYNMSGKIKKTVNNLPSNVKLIKNRDNLNLAKGLNVCNYVIYYHSNYETLDNLNYILQSKKQLLVHNNEIFSKYLINSKNAYLFESNEELEKKLMKILEGRLANLSIDGYLLIKDNDFASITHKIKQIFK